MIKPPNRSLVAPRAQAESELRALLDEIPTWSDAMLLHMHHRFGTGRLFRVRHGTEEVLTEGAKRLRMAARDEIDRRGLALFSDDM